MGKEFTIEFDTDEFFRKLDFANKAVQESAKRGVNDCVDELIRISSEITPIDKGTLTKSHAKEVTVGGDGVEGKVEYSVMEGGFDYALWIHEGDYELGPNSIARGGTSGWSGKGYRVGNKYLERPAKGEQEAFLKRIAEEIRREIGEG